MGGSRILCLRFWARQVGVAMQHRIDGISSPESHVHRSRVVQAACTPGAQKVQTPSRLPSKRPGPAPHRSESPSRLDRSQGASATCNSGFNLMAIPFSTARTARPISCRRRRSPTVDRTAATGRQRLLHRRHRSIAISRKRPIDRDGANGRSGVGDRPLKAWLSPAAAIARQGESASRGRSQRDTG